MTVKGGEEYHVVTDGLYFNTVTHALQGEQRAIDSYRWSHMLTNNSPRIYENGFGRWEHGNNWYLSKDETNYYASGQVEVWSDYNRDLNKYPYYVGQFRGPQPYEGTYMYPVVNIHDEYGNLVGAEAYAAEAWRRMKPTAPNFSLLNAVYELKDVPDMLKQGYKTLFHDVQHARDVGKYPSKLGEYYLALKFGWMPLWNDTKDFVGRQRKGQDRIKQLLRDEGKPVRRRVELHSDSDSMTRPNSYGNYNMSPVLPSSFYVGVPTGDEKFSYNRRVWAAARFRYWLPEGPRNVDWTNSMLRRIYGERLTPSVVYNALPWTWLGDFFGNLGDVIDNLDDGVADRLVADYFYVMVEHTATHQVNLTGTITGKNGPEPVSMSSNRVLTNKIRVGASPFGPAFKSLSDLSQTQTYILGALGLSRL